MCHSRSIKRTFSMRKSKKSQLQQQASQKAQARAAATIPIHRESIVNLRGSVVPRTFETMADVTNIPTGQQADNSDQRRISFQDNHQDPPLSSEWETKFCVEPPGDFSTCLLGTFVPCVLYGKVNWRFERMANGQGASKYDWESRNGCNGLCWTYCGSLFTGAVLPGRVSPSIVPEQVMTMSKFLLTMVVGIMAGFQRAEVRGTYGIKGNLASDIVLGIFLGPCVLMQNDREFRCREGAQGLAHDCSRATNNHEQTHDAGGALPPCYYVNGKRVFGSQPGTHPPMEARVHSITRPENDRPMIEHGPKKLKTVDKKSAKIPVSREMQSENVQTKRESAGKAQYNQSESSELVVLKKRTQNQRAVPIVVITGPEDSNRTTKDISSNQSPEQHALIERSASKAEDENSKRQHHPTAPTNNALQSNEIGNGTIDVHTLNECRPSIEHTSSSKGVKQHALAGCDQSGRSYAIQPTNGSQEAEEIDNDRADIHTLNECQPALEAASAPRAVQQHSRAKCEESPSIPPKVKETSYAHDFSQCPRPLVQYYKKGGRKAEPQPHAVPSTESSEKNGKRAEREEPTSESAENSKNNKKSLNVVKEHLPDGCPKSSCENCEFIESGVSKDDPNDRARLTTHNLESCAVEISSASGNSVQQHSIAECASVPPRESSAGLETQTRTTSSSVRDISDGVLQHRLSSCPIPSPVNRKRLVDHATNGLNVDGVGERPLGTFCYTL